MNAYMLVIRHRYKEINQSINQDILNVPANKCHVGAHGKNEWN